MMISLLLASVLAVPPATIYDFKMDNIDGKPVELKQFKGKVLLVVNVASKCGNTPQYAGLESLFQKYKKDGFSVLGFPANEFGGQEPGTNAEIKEFCTETYKVQFPMFGKIVVKGEGTHPLYKWLVQQTEDKKEVSWNFEKFLIGRDGKVVARFSPRTQPNDPALVAALEGALQSK